MQGTNTNLLMVNSKAPGSFGIYSRKLETVTTVILVIYSDGTVGI